MKRKKIDVVRTCGDSIESFSWTPLEFEVYQIARSLGSDWEDIEVGECSTDPVTDRAVELLTRIGVIELCTTIKLSQPSRAEVMTSTYIHTGLVGQDAYERLHRKLLVSEGWRGGPSVVEPESMKMRLSSDWCDLEIEGVDRHQNAVELVKLADGEHHIPGRLRPETIDVWLPAKWYTDVTGAPASRLRKAAERSKIDTIEDRGTVLYSRSGFKRLWPQDAKW